jgi:hypothetical protein
MAKRIVRGAGIVTIVLIACGVAGIVLASAAGDDAADCAAICSAHFRQGSPEHRECVACCYDPDCQ